MMQQGMWNGKLQRALALMMLGGFVVLTPQSAQADNLCPDVETAKQNSPQDVAGVQASIERLNLCVERARLLKQLDDIAKQREEVLTNITAPEMPVGGIGGIPPMSGAILPSLPGDTSNLKAGDVKVTGAAGDPFNAAAAALQSAVVKKPSWKVRKIWGQGDSMRAQLSDGTGTLLNVVRGDVMPDGQVVESVSVRGVAISQKGKVTDLPWDDMAGETGTK